MKKWYRKIRLTENNCWERTTNITSEGYAKIKRQHAHRWVWKALGRDLPDNMHLHHVCGNKVCVNPWHMVMLTPSQHATLHNPPQHRTHCPRGHEYDATNTYTNPQGVKICRTCNREATRRRRA